MTATRPKFVPGQLVTTAVGVPSALCLYKEIRIESLASWDISGTATASQVMIVICCVSIERHQSEWEEVLLLAGEQLGWRTALYFEAVE